MFIEDNFQALSHFVRLSRALGARPDYVQGGGGNTSVKLKDGLMAIKASGYCLGDIRTDKAYAVMDYTALRDFYCNHQISDFEDLEKAGSDCAKANTKTIEGMDALRPSVEAGFHSILKTYVLHTHSVYANLAACSTSCKELVKTAFAGADYSWVWVPYCNPGVNLTFVIRDAMAQVQEQTGKVPSVIFMQNHGLVVHDDDPDICLALHADANERIAKLFGITGTSFPKTGVRKLAAGFYTADVPYLKECLTGDGEIYETLMEKPLYPDQMVFLGGTFFMDTDTVEAGQCVASSETGEMLMKMPEKTARTLVETLTAVFFIMEKIEKAGYCVSTMGDSARSFIANWESEKYRKSIGGGKG